MLSAVNSAFANDEAEVASASESESSAHEEASDDDYVDAVENKTRKRAAPGYYAERKVQKGRPAAKKPKTVSAAVENRIHSNVSIRQNIAQSHIRRDAWLWHHRDLFLPLLPVEKNFFRHIDGGSMLKPVPYDLVQQPEGVKGEMKDYQLRGLSYLVMLHRNGMNGILGDEMGLGKTLQTLSLFSYVREQGSKGPFLVLCPLSVLSSWENEVARWVPHLSCMVLHGTMAERERLMHVYTQNRPDILITTYEQYVLQAFFFKQITWLYVVLDEGHKIKNEKTQVSIALRGLSSQYRLLLTGTPLQNNLHELWALLHWLFPEVFTPVTVSKFDEAFDLTKGVYDLSALGHSRALLEKIMLRRMKAQVDFQIPPKEEIVLYVPLSPMQRFWYKRLLTGLDTMTLRDIFPDTTDVKPEDTNGPVTAYSHDAEKNGFGETKAIIEHSMKTFSAGNGADWKRLMNVVMQLRKCCNHPYTLPESEPEPFVSGEHLVLASSKMVLLDKLLKHLRAGGHRTLIFSGFTGTLDILEDFMIYRGVSYCRLDGSTSRPRRTLDIRLFNHKESPYEIFLISTRAGGLGINLTSADTVIFYDSDWNPQSDIQALARAHRIGQTKPVTVYRLVCQDTVEEQMLGRLQKKLYLSAKVTEDMADHTVDDSAEPSFSKGELMSMLRRGARAVTKFDDSDKFLNSTIEHILETSRVKQVQVDAEMDVEPEDDFVLEGMEQVKSRLFEGVTVKKGTTSAKAIGREWQEMAKRVREERTVMIDGHAVMKNTVGLDDWEACATLSKGHVVPPKRRKRVYAHETCCQKCAAQLPDKVRLECRLCPRSYHAKCAGPQLAVFSKMHGFKCPQHQCKECHKDTASAGGLLFRCQSCPNTYCETCTQWDDIVPIGDVLPELLMLDFTKVTQAFYIRCPSCVTRLKEKPELAAEQERKTEQAWKDLEESDAKAAIEAAKPPVVEADANKKKRPVKARKVGRVRKAKA
ncbi:hypothetical protein HDU87_006109 [Geranomyces variabilis]|uniref:Uncharacterized protein n=1 Tax=Geranomyces variabilis TaxID=109894 RepID=A0AAD5XKR2_9FUNG|nr:hypothetical protein HDU87_006109 [Geranomyces variabilis]